MQSSKPCAAQLVRFDGEEAGDDGDLALAADRVAHGLAGRLALQVQVGADEEQALVGFGGLGVEGGDRDAGVHGLVDEGHHAGVTGDGGDGIVLLDDGRLDGLAEDLAGVLVAGHDPVDGHAVGLQFFGGLERAFLDRDPERVVLQTQHGDLHRLGRLLVHRLDRGFVGRRAHFLGCRRRQELAGARRRPELIDVVLGDDIGLGDQLGALGVDLADQVVVQADGRVMALGEGVLADGGRDDALLDVLHGLLDEVEGDDLDLAGLAGLLDGLGRAEGAAGGDVDAGQVRVGRHEVVGLGEGDVALVGVLDRSDDRDVGVVLLDAVLEAVCGAARALRPRRSR